MQVDDDTVVDSFISSVLPGGWMRRWLQAGRLAFLHGSTLYTYGGVQCFNCQTVGHVPGVDKVEGVQDWVIELQRWKDEQVVPSHLHGRIAKK